MTTAATKTSQDCSHGVALPAETVVLTVVFVIALGLRAIALGKAPLSISEAELASAAASLVGNGGHVESVLMYVLSLVSFTIAGTSNAAARFWPMLAGLGLSCCPLLFRRQLGRVPVAIAMAILAISPVAVSASRRLGGTGISMLALLVCLALIDRYLSERTVRSFILLGVTIGVAMLADYSTWVALLTLSAGFGFALLTDEEEFLTPNQMATVLKGVRWGAVILGFVTVIGVVGTVFLIFPSGLGDAANQLTLFLRGFIQRIPGVIYPGLGLMIYQPGLLLFGLYGTWLTSQSPSPRERLLAGWGMAGVIAVLAYPGTRPEHILWAVVPLALLAGLSIDALFARRHSAPGWRIGLQAVLYLALLAMIWAGLLHHLTAPRLLTLPAGAPPDQVAATIPLDLVLVLLWMVLLGTLIMAGTSFWGAAAATRGATLAGVILFGVLALGQSTATAWTRSTSPYEPANVNPAQPGLNRLVFTARDIGDLAVGYPYDAQLVIETSTGHLPVWALREFHDSRIVEHADPTVDSMMVITPAGDTSVALGSDYVGQDFVIERSWSPVGLSIADTLRWVIYRTAPTPTSEQRVILWVREDVYRLVPAGGEPAQ